MNDDEQIFALRLQELINLLGFRTMSSFADAIGVSSSIIQKYLGKNGHYTQPNTITLKKIKNRFPEVDLNWLLADAEGPLTKTPLNPIGASGEGLRLKLDAAESRVAELEKQVSEKQLLVNLLRQQTGL